MTREEYNIKISQLKDKAKKAEDFFEMASIQKRFRDFCAEVDPQIVEYNPVLLDRRGNLIDYYIINRDVPYEV